MDPSDSNISFVKILVVNLSDGCDTSSFLLGQVPIPPQLHLIMNERTTTHSYLSLHPSSTFSHYFSKHRSNAKGLYCLGLVSRRHNHSMFPAFHSALTPQQRQPCCPFQLPGTSCRSRRNAGGVSTRSTTTMGIQDIRSIAVNRTRRLRKTRGRA